MPHLKIHVIEIGEQQAPHVSSAPLARFFNRMEQPDAHQLPQTFSTQTQKVYLKSYTMRKGVPHWNATMFPVFAMDIYGWDKNTHQIIQEFVKKRGGKVKTFTASWSDDTPEI